MLLHCSLGDPQPVSDTGVRTALSHQRGHVAFACGELAEDTVASLLSGHGACPRPRKACRRLVTGARAEGAGRRPGNDATKLPGDPQTRAQAVMPSRAMQAAWMCRPARRHSQGRAGSC